MEVSIVFTAITRASIFLLLAGSAFSGDRPFSPVSSVLRHSNEDLGAYAGVSGLAGYVDNCEHAIFADVVAMKLRIGRSAVLISPMSDDQRRLFRENSGRFVSASGDLWRRSAGDSVTLSASGVFPELANAKSESVVDCLPTELSRFKFVSIDLLLDPRSSHVPGELISTIGVLGQYNEGFGIYLGQEDMTAELWSHGILLVPDAGESLDELLRPLAGKYVLVAGFLRQSPISRSPKLLFERIEWMKPEGLDLHRIPTKAD